MMTQEKPTLIRDLSDEEFAAKYKTDPFTASVLGNRLRASAEHVGTDLLHRAFSPIIALAMDYVCAICGPPEQNYRMVTATNGLTVFLGTIQDGVRTAVEEYGVDRLVPGDLLICNDAVRMGNHPNDMCYIRPIFHDGRIVSFMVLRAHMLDIGGITPGGFSARKHNVYENGLVVSPRLLFHAEEPVRETFSLLLDNVRFGEIQLPDQKTIHSCCRLGEQMIQDCISRYGIDAYLGTLDYNCDSTAERMRTALEELPDGDYYGEGSLDADAVDADETYLIKIKLTKRGGNLEADLSGSSRQARTSINAGALDTKTALGVGLKILLDPHGHFTSGSFRNIDIVLPPGTIASALPPDGAVFFYFEVGHAIMSALIDALSDALGDRAVAGDTGSNNVHNAYGVMPDGSAWACSAVAGAETGPVGADRNGDGEGHSCPYLTNIISPATEAIEAAFPVMIMQKEYATDTAGVGRHRGGAAIRKDILWTAEAEHEPAPFRFRNPSGLGVFGGRDGRQGGVWLFNRNGAEADFIPDTDAVYPDATPIAGLVDSDTNLLDPSGNFAYYGRESWTTAPGATWRYLSNAGGGWGNPIDRAPDDVRRDVRDGYISVASAAERYGVVIDGDPDYDPEGLTVDVEGTAELRRNLTAAPMS
ncbi:MAG: hydantoinase B/oxoprolinase family protein [Rhodococcus sp. (in: high G+C Gram-positive bacteria)]